MLAWQRRAQLGLDLLGRRRLGDADAVGHAQDMAIDRQAGDAEGVAEDDVRRLAADAGQGRQRVHVGGHLAAVVLEQGMRHAKQHLGLLPEEARGHDLRFELRGGGGGEPSRIRVALEERRRDLVHARVRRLRREDRRDEELEGGREIELGSRVWMLAVQPLEDGLRVPGPLGCGRRSGARALWRTGHAASLPRTVTPSAREPALTLSSSAMSQR